MKRVSVTALTRNFSKYLQAVERGETVQIWKRGRVVARVVPDCEFMDGKKAAALFAHHKSDPETADAIERELARLKQEEDDALANRH